MALPVSGGAPLAGYKAPVTINGTAHFTMDWSVEPTSTWIDCMGHTSGGFMEKVAGHVEAVVQMDGYLNIGPGGANPFDAPLYIRVGATLSNVRLYYYDTSGPYWHFPFLNVVTTPSRTQVQSKCELSVRGEGHGSWSYPTGVVSSVTDVWGT